MKEVLKQSAVVCFLGLLLIKTSAFHIYEHHDSLNDQESQCEYCLFVIESQNAEILFEASESGAIFFFTDSYSDEVISSDALADLAPSRSALLSRPPPTSL